MHRLAVAVALTGGLAYGQGRGAPLIDILTQELARNFQALKAKGDPPPYFIAYSAVESQTDAVSASMGALLRSNRVRDRYFDCSVRVGTPQFDNYHLSEGDRAHFARVTGLPLDDLAGPVRRIVWKETDRVYQAAVQRLIRIKTRTQMKTEQAETSDDFSSEPPVAASEPPPSYDFPREKWEARLRKLSSAFNEYPGILNSAISVTSQRDDKVFVNTEGTKLQHGWTMSRVTLSVRGKAADGQDLSLFDSFEAADPSRLPSDETLRAAIAALAERFTKLQRAPSADPYVGPAILSGRAAAVFFHEIFGHRIEGHRQKDEAEGQTFAKRVGTPILPAFLSVIFDATKRKQDSTDLMGAYRYDDEGVRARRVTLVDNGVLKEFLMSRTPIPGFPKSNGHGRKEIGQEVVSRQSNLFVEAATRVTDKELRARLIDEVKKQNKPYGLYFDQVTGGFTTTGRRGLQAFTVIPLVVYRIFPDGRPDELVRGVDIVGTPLTSFEKILAAGGQPQVFNGYCGAESGNVPVSAISPALLISEIETQRKANPGDRPPFLPRPTETGDGL